MYQDYYGPTLYEKKENHLDFLEEDEEVEEKK